jgi:hypothetical protein
MSLREAINQMCKSCIYDPLSAGSWRQHVFLCSVKSCPLSTHRAKPTSPVPDSTLRWYGVDSAEFQALMKV